MAGLAPGVKKLRCGARERSLSFIVVLIEYDLAPAVFGTPIEGPAPAGRVWHGLVRAGAGGGRAEPPASSSTCWLASRSVPLCAW